MSPHRIPALAFAADVVAVIVFAAVGRANHASPGDVMGLLGTVAPFAAGLLAAWSVPVVRADPAGLRAGAVVLVGTAVVGLALRAAFLGRLPLSFVIVTVIALAVLMLGWRTLAAAVSRTMAHRAG